MRALPTASTAIASAILLLACGGDIGHGRAGDSGAPDGAADAGPGTGADGADPGAACRAPDMLILLDRTMSMHRMPSGAVPENSPDGHASSKWALAVGSLEAVTAALEDHVRFGLALFPRDPDDGSCVTLQQRIEGTSAQNPRCEVAEIVVEPALASAAAIADTIEVETTPLCRSTPIGAGLSTAREALAARADGEREQFVVLVTDGQDTCDEQLVLSTAQRLYAEGVRVYAIGFDAAGGTGVDPALLNDLACAGGTAPDFPDGCVDQGGGAYLAERRTGPALFHLATDAAALQAALETVASEVCCGCID